MSTATVSLPAVRAIRVDYACGAVALVLVLLSLWISIAGHGYRISTLVRMVQSDPIAAETQEIPDWEYTPVHYDGIYFFAIALDPLAQGKAHTLIDLGANRYGHPAYGWAAGVLGLFGPDRVPVALLLVSLVSIFAAGVYASRLASVLGWTPWGGLIIAFNPGLLFAATNDTSEAFGTALLCLSLWAWLSGRLRVATLAIMVGCFAKEHLLLVPLGLGIWEAAQLIRVGSTRVPLRRFALLAIGPALYAVWMVYVHSVFGVWSFAEADNLSLPVPFIGWLNAMNGAAQITTNDYLGYQIGASALALQLIAISLILLGVIRAIRFRSPIDAVYLLVAVLMVYLRDVNVFFAKDMLRSLAFAYVLLPFVLITPRWLPQTEASGLPESVPSPQPAGTG